ncbi:MAG: Crp/Fnr family transcriptional regulator [Cytophagaceae bacterium]|jgi:CRP/FNR family transcriptional regulator|nr:Crp/Fnr family transcriptional regulator [Cytophagaceae bacterium]
MTLELFPFHQVDFKNAIEARAIRKEFAAGEVILREQMHVQAIPLIEKGLLGVYRTEESGKEMLLYYIRPGESCIMSFLAGMHQDTSKIQAIAEEETTLLLLPIQDVSNWIKLYPEWIDYIFKLYHQRFEELLNVVNALAFQKMDDRLAQHLKKKADITGQRELMVTHQQLADELGTTREVISRILKQMEKNGLVTLLRNKIILM